MQNNPQVVFERLFGDGNTAEQRKTRRAQSISLLDSVAGRSHGAAAQAAGVGSDAPRSVSERRARDRAARAEGRAAALGRPAGAGRADRRAARRRGAHQADVRPAGAGVAGGDHARVHVPDVQGAERRDLSEERRPRRLPHAVASLQREGEHRSLRGAEHVSRRRSSRTSWTSCAPRRTATARCSITRWSSTAAA